MGRQWARLTGTLLACGTLRATTCPTASCRPPGLQSGTTDFGYGNNLMGESRTYVNDIEGDSRIEEIVKNEA